MGTERSCLLVTTIPLDRKNANHVLRTVNGELLPWEKTDKNGRIRTDLEVINSHTRSSKKITEDCRKPLWELILETNPQVIKKFA